MNNYTTNKTQIDLYFTSDLINPKQKDNLKMYTPRQASSNIFTVFLNLL